MAYNRYNRRRFGGRSSRQPATAVMQETKTAKKRAKCKACSQSFEVGDTVVRLRLRKMFRAPCATCGHKLLGVRWYHTACVPTDLNAAMGFDPTAHAAAGHVVPPAVQHTVPPPAKPQSATDASLGALLAIENALRRRLAENPSLVKDASLAALLKTYNGCKSRALRPGTDAEGIVAMKMALKKALDLMF